jgi:8-hydroxy-5-deazaflavin:NADPH oxidoreductase
MQFGTIGAGAIAQAVAGHVLKAGHEVILSNSRGPDSLNAVVTEFGPGASAGTLAEAADADMVLLAAPWDRVQNVAAALPTRDGRIIIDATNQFSLEHRELADLGDQTGSEYIASLIPGARVIKAFNTLYARYLAADPRHTAGRQVIFYAGDDPDAKQQFGLLLDEIGFAPVDMGSLRDGGRPMQIDGGPLSALHVLKQD